VRPLSSSSSPAPFSAPQSPRVCGTLTVLRLGQRQGCARSMKTGRVCRNRLDGRGFGDSTGRADLHRVDCMGATAGQDARAVAPSISASATSWRTAMDAAARVGGSDVVAGRGDLIRGGRRRERSEDWSAAMLERRTALESLSSMVRVLHRRNVPHAGGAPTRPHHRASSPSPLPRFRRAPRPDRAGV
jgi:hypothetical protein